MFSKLLGIFKDPDKRTIVSWLGGGAVVIAGGIWTVVAFVVEHKDAHDKNGGTAVTLSGPEIVSGGNTGIGGNVTIGPNKEQITQIQKSFAEQLAMNDTRIAALTKLLPEKSGGGAGHAEGSWRGGPIDRARRGQRRQWSATSPRPLEGR
jgi:hypothetical protein